MRNFAKCRPVNELSPDEVVDGGAVDVVVVVVAVLLAAAGVLLVAALQGEEKRENLFSKTAPKCKSCVTQVP